MVSASRCREPLSSDIGLRTSVVQLSPRARLANLLFALVVAGTFGAEALYAQATIRVRDSSISVSESGTVDQPVWLLTQPSGDVTITLTNEPPVLVTMSTTSLTFTPSNWNTKQTVTFSGVDDAVENAGTRRDTIKFTASGGGYDASTAKTILDVFDDDTKAIFVFGAPLSMRRDLLDVGNLVPLLEDEPKNQFVSLGSQPTGDVTISLAAQPPTLVTMSPMSLTFTRSNWNTEQTVTYSAMDDAVLNTGDNTVPFPRVAMITFTASGADYDGLARPGGIKTRVIVIDDEPQPLPYPLNEGSSYPDTREINIDSYWDPVVVRPTSSNPSVVTVTPAEVILAPGGRRTIGLTITAVDNAVYDVGPVTISLPIDMSPSPLWFPLRSRLVTVVDDGDPPAPPSDPPEDPEPPSDPPEDPEPSSSEPFVDLVPVFADTARIADLVVEVDQAIDPQTLPTATGGDGVLRYSLSDNLPEGLVFNAARRQLWGTPTVETDSAAAMIYKVLDADADFDTLLFTITVTPPDLKPTFGDAMITDLFAEVDQSVAWPLPEATGGDGVLRYSLSNLPDGLALNAMMRQLYGAATATDTTVAAYTARDADGDTATLMFTVTIIDPNRQPTFGDATIAALFAEVDQAIDPRTLPAASGGNGPLAYSLSHLPAGLAFNADTRQVRGAATATDTTVATYTVTDADGDAATLPFTITVIDPDLQPTFGTATIEPLTATACQVVAWPLPAATGGDGALAYSLSNLPAGLVFNADTRQVRGTPTVLNDAGQTIPYEGTYTVTDADGDAATLPFTITVHVGLDAPEWMRAENYLGADRTGSWEGLVLLTWALSKPAHLL